MKIDFIDKFIIRTPFASTSDLEVVKEIKNIHKDGLSFIKTTFTGNFKTALLYATKNFYFEIIKSLEAQVVSEKVLFSYLKYYIRYCSRSTPFGLFSTYGIARLEKSNENSIVLDETQVKSRISLSYIYDLCSEIIKNRNLWSSFFVFSNQTIYLIGDSIRYNELYFDGNTINYRLSSVEANDVLDEILKISTNGIPYKDLQEKVQAFGYDKEEVSEYLNDLFENNVIVPDIFPSPATNEYVEDFLNNLKKIPNNLEKIFIKGKETSIQEIIVEVSDMLQNVTSIFSNDSTGEFEKTISEDSNKYDIVTFRNAKARLDSKLFYNITTTLQSLSYLNLSKRGKEASLGNFIKEFIDKYGESEMPLLQVVDSELGIFNDRVNSISTPLLDDINLTGGRPDMEYRFNKVDKLLFEKYEHAIRNNKYEIIISKDECQQFNESRRPILNQTLNCNVGFYKDINSKIVTVINGAFGSSAINNVGRFSFGSDELTSFTKEIVDIENQLSSEAVEFAEIIDLPHLRHGNLVVRESFLKSEIPINIAKTSNNGKTKISLADIYVSVRDGDVILRDVKSGKIIIPRLSNSHNFQLQNLSNIYRFLSLVQIQWDESVNFSWGFIDNFAKFKPRVIIEKTIVKEATWTFNNVDLEFLKEDLRNDSIHGFINFRKSWKIPEQIFLIEGDNKLLFDFSSDIYSKLFINLISKKDEITIIENLLQDHRSIVNINEKSYFSEFIIPVVFSSDNSLKLVAEKFDIQENQLSPLSQCFYLSIFTGEQQIDSIIKNELLTLNEELAKKNLVEKFFFIRYNENGHHLRLRYFLQNENVYNELFDSLRRFFKKYIDNKTIKKIDINTYQRELERYSYLGISFTENYFSLESKMVIILIQMLEGLNINERWLTGLVYINMLLDKMGYDLSQKSELFVILSNQFNREFNGNKYLTKKIASKYKNNEKDIYEVMAGRNERFDSIFAFFTRFLQSVSFPDLKLGQDKIGKYQYTGSLIHMFLNRLLISQHRKQELIIYNYMSKFYISELNRN
ncbi:lantibiotic dehydratase [Chryseobacterium sp. RLHN22]|uniref:lantibiotic dehydratase n=1 Tax=Chryseobacterium sp. RLHN22 TaxID=3437885 RepID=UPI003D9B81D9